MMFSILRILYNNLFCSITFNLTKAKNFFLFFYKFFKYKQYSFRLCLHNVNNKILFPFILFIYTWHYVLFTNFLHSVND